MRNVLIVSVLCIPALLLSLPVYAVSSPTCAPQGHVVQLPCDVGNVCPIGYHYDMGSTVCIVNNSAPMPSSDWVPYNQSIDQCSNVEMSQFGACNYACHTYFGQNNTGTASTNCLNGCGDSRNTGLGICSGDWQ